MTRYPKGGRGSRWTSAELKSIPASWQGDTIADGDGLSGEVRVSLSGAISVRFKSAFKWEGKVAWHQCGTWPATSMAEIREARDKARQLVKQGINPNDHKKAVRVESREKVEATLAEARRREAEDLSFRSMFEAWLADGVSRDDRNAELKRTFEKDVVPFIGDKPVRLVDDNDLRSVLRRVGRERGAGRTAQRMLSELRQLYRWSLSRNPWRTLLRDGNPADLVDPRQVVNDDYEEGIRERVLSEAEIRELHNILLRQREEYESLPAGQRHKGARPLKRESELALWIMLSTLCRAGETLKAAWKDVDLDKGEWLLPAANTKTKVAMTVYLSPFALRQFQELHKLTGHTQWCFPARAKGRAREGAAPPAKHVYEKSVSKQVGDRQVRFMQRDGSFDHRKHDDSLVLANGERGEWTPHDLRRTGATLMQAMGIPLDTIDRCQNHKLPGPKVRRHYLHHEYVDEKRAAWRRLGERLAAILNDCTSPDQRRSTPGRQTGTPVVLEPSSSPTDHNDSAFNMLRS
jgi:integrase